MSETVMSRRAFDLLCSDIQTALPPMVADLVENGQVIAPLEKHRFLAVVPLADGRWARIAIAYSGGEWDTIGILDVDGVYADRQAAREQLSQVLSVLP